MYVCWGRKADGRDQTSLNDATQRVCDTQSKTSIGANKHLRWKEQKKVSGEAATSWPHMVYAQKATPHLCSANLQVTEVTWKKPLTYYEKKPCKSEEIGSFGLSFVKKVTQEVKGES